MDGFLNPVMYIYIPHQLLQINLLDLIALFPLVYHYMMTVIFRILKTTLLTLETAMYHMM